MADEVTSSTDTPLSQGFDLASKVALRIDKYTPASRPLAVGIVTMVLIAGLTITLVQRGHKFELCFKMAVTLAAFALLVCVLATIHDLIRTQMEMAHRERSRLQYDAVFEARRRAENALEPS